MRTTVDVPDALARQAKLAAVRRGVKLREFFIQALEHELEGNPRRDGSLAELPTIHSQKPGSCRLTSDEINAILVREEEAAYEAAQRR